MRVKGGYDVMFSRSFVGERSVGASLAFSGERTSWRKHRTRASLRGSWEEKAAASQHKSCPSDKPLGASLSVSLSGLSCKSACRILDTKNRPIDG